MANQSKALSWLAWETTERIMAHPAICNRGYVEKFPHLIFTLFDNGLLRLGASRQPLIYVSDSLRIASEVGGKVESVLISATEIPGTRIIQQLNKQFRQEGFRHHGRGLFKDLPIQVVLDALRAIRAMDEPPPQPAKAGEMLTPSANDVFTFDHSRSEKMLSMNISNTTSTSDYCENAISLLQVADTAITQDQAGRYCLNDLHRAAGGEQKLRPKYWLENKQTIDLIDEISKGGIPPLEIIHGGNNPGTFVIRELVYAYAMWISPKFHLSVIRAFDALVSGQISALPEMPKLSSSLTGYPALDSAIDFRSWRLAEEHRDATMKLLNANAGEDQELSWNVAFKVRQRVQENLLRFAKTQLDCKVRPERVVPWVMNWSPQAPLCS